jgi:hypothetical protein
MRRKRVPSICFDGSVWEDQTNACLSGAGRSFLTRSEPNVGLRSPQPPDCNSRLQEFASPSQSFISDLGTAVGAFLQHVARLVPTSPLRPGLQRLSFQCRRRSFPIQWHRPSRSRVLGEIDIEFRWNDTQRTVRYRQVPKDESIRSTSGIPPTAAQVPPQAFNPPFESLLPLVRVCSTRKH